MSVSRSATLRWTPRRSILGGEFGEEPFDEVEPGAAGRGEVQVEAGVADEPAADLGRFVGGVVVQDEVHVVLGGDLSVELVEELAELGGAVLAMQAAVDVAGGYIECGEQAGRAVADVGRV